MTAVLNIALKGTRVKQEKQRVMIIQVGDESRLVQSRYMGR